MADHEARYMSPNDVLMVYIMNLKKGIILLALSHSRYRGKHMVEFRGFDPLLAVCEL